MVEFTELSIYCSVCNVVVLSGRFYQPVQPALCQWKLVRESCEVRIKVSKRVSISWPYPIMGDASGEIVCDPQSHFLLGLFYQRENDMSTALEHWDKAAKKKHTDSSFFLGKLYVLNGDAKKAVALLRTAAEAGHCEAMYTLGETHQQGLFPKSSLRQALQWYEKCMEHDALQLHLQRLHMDTFPPFVINAHYNAAMIYLNPANKELYDLSMGLKLLRVAAKSGHAHALHRLGKMLLEGKQIERNVERGCAYIREAIDLNPSIKISSNTRKILEIVNVKKRNMAHDRVPASHPSPLRRNKRSNDDENSESILGEDDTDSIQDDELDEFKGVSMNASDHTPIPSDEDSFWKSSCCWSWSGRGSVDSRTKGDAGINDTKITT
eukprot:m.19395 g.19395  ORF g.19395 m.19395 type:complete len:380 (+) comp5108_c0_seq1:328-1467(+)